MAGSRRLVMTETTWFVVFVGIAAIAVVCLLALKWNRTKNLRSKFGPEYDHLVSEQGNAVRAEKELERRAKRVEKFHIHPLTREECDRFATQWSMVQQRFVDDPKAAVAEADNLVQHAMHARGYPVGEFEDRAADLSVDHPLVVKHYRAAHNIALRDSRSEATTEELRIALQHYRTLFQDLLEVREVSLQEVQR
jgi:hypothetical protein